MENTAALKGEWNLKLAETEKEKKRDKGQKLEGRFKWRLVFKL